MSDGFVCIEGIPGESSDENHGEWIEILDFDVDVSQTLANLPSSLGGACAEKADFSEFSFSKLMDRATPKLAQACAAGTHIDKIEVELVRAGGEKSRFMKFIFSNCRISSLTTTAQGDFPEDEVAFFYGKVEWCYTPQACAGGWSAGNVATGWSLEKNCRA